MHDTKVKVYILCITSEQSCVNMNSVNDTKTIIKKTNYDNAGRNYNADNAKKKKKRKPQQYMTSGAKIFSYNLLALSEKQLYSFVDDLLHV